MDFFKLLQQIPFWQAVTAFGLWHLFSFLKNLYTDSGKQFFADWLKHNTDKLAFKLNFQKGKLDKELSIIILEGAFSRVENELISEIIKVFDINDRHSEHRKAQIPGELRRAAGRGLAMVLPTLFRYHYKKNWLATPFLRIQQNVEAKDQFWAPVLKIITESQTTQDRTEAINFLNILTAILLENAINELKNGN